MKNLTEKDNTVCVLGLGYVGLTLATVLSDVGFNIYGVDKNEQVIDSLRIGKSHFYEKGLEELLSKLLISTNPPKFDCKIENQIASIYIITVGTPIIKSSSEPNLDYVINASVDIGNILKKGDLVILRSTVPVGTTRNIVLPILEKISGLKINKDFDLAFCPERTVEGKALTELKELPQIIGGFNEKSIQRASDFFNKFTNEVINVGELESAEMIKILNNTFRDIIFAYSNQMALLCQELNLNMVKLTKAANYGYKRDIIPLPSPGVGGACLSKDPYILASVCKNYNVDNSLFLLGRKINEGMCQNILTRIENEFIINSKKINGAKIFILGFAFKGRPATSDMRDSSTIDLVNLLLSRKANLYGNDPLVKKSEISSLGVIHASLDEGFKNADAVIIMTNHIEYEQIDIDKLVKTMNKPAILMDGWQLFNSEILIQNNGIKYMSIGS